MNLSGFGIARFRAFAASSWGLGKFGVRGSRFMDLQRGQEND